jgi:hypothetical protein
MSETLKSWKEKLYHFLKINVKEEESVIQEVEEQTEIPEDYKRRFDLDPVMDPGQLLGRQDIQDQIAQAFENWKISNNPLLIVAEHGVGMSSLINCNSQIFDDLIIVENIVNIGTRAKLIKILKDNLKLGDEIKNLNQIAEALDEDTKKTIVFENVERLFLRRVNGFNVLEDFLLFIHNTKNKIFWVITINDYSYYYLNETKAFASNFLSTIKLKGLKESFIEEAISKRNTGYNVVYLKPEKLNALPNGNTLTADEQQRQWEEQFYKSMLSVSKGNISIAFIYWLKAVKKIDEKFVYLKAFEPNPFSDMTLDELLTLEAIHQHSSLSANELQQVLRNSKKLGQLTIEYLMERELVFPLKYKDGSVEYKLNLFHLHTVLSLFHSRLNRNFKQ